MCRKVNAAKVPTVLKRREYEMSASKRVKRKAENTDLLEIERVNNESGYQPET